MASTRVRSSMAVAHGFGHIARLPMAFREAWPLDNHQAVAVGIGTAGRRCCIAARNDISVVILTTNHHGLMRALRAGSMVEHGPRLSAATLACRCFLHWRGTLSGHGSAAWSYVLPVNSRYTCRIVIGAMPRWPLRSMATCKHRQCTNR